jgi:hypothetical protein
MDLRTQQVLLRHRKFLNNWADLAPKALALAFLMNLTGFNLAPLRKCVNSLAF